jgi:hypothetical protein
MIAEVDPGWTDHNPSDPGITLIELFAWLTEMLLYRLDRTPDRVVNAFLRLLAGPGWTPTGERARDIRNVLSRLEEPERAVTAADFERRALQVMERKGRAHCVPRFDITAPAGELVEHEGHLSVVIIPPKGQELGAPPVPSDDLRNRVEEDLVRRRLLGTRLHVGRPLYVSIQLDVVVLRKREADRRTVVLDLERTLRKYLDPLHGGPEGKGWPFESPVYLADLMYLVQGLRGVESVTHLFIKPDLDPLLGGDPRDWNKDGTLVGVRTLRHHLPWVKGLEVVALPPVVEFVLVGVQIKSRGLSAAQRADARYEVERRLAPLPGGDATWQTNTRRLFPDLLRGLSGVRKVTGNDELKPNQVAEVTVDFSETDGSAPERTL